LNQECNEACDRGDIHRIHIVKNGNSGDVVEKRNKIIKFYGEIFHNFKSKKFFFSFTTHRKMEQDIEWVISSTPTTALSVSDCKIIENANE